MRYLIAIQDFQKFLSVAQSIPGSFKEVHAFFNRPSHRLANASNVRSANLEAMQELMSHHIQFSIVETEN